MPSLMWSPGSPGPEFDTHASPPYTSPNLISNDCERD